MNTLLRYLGRARNFILFSVHIVQFVLANVLSTLENLTTFFWAGERALHIFCSLFPGKQKSAYRTIARVYCTLHAPRAYGPHAHAQVKNYVEKEKNKLHWNKGIDFGLLRR